MVFGRGRDQQKPDHKAIEAKVDEEMHGLVTQLTNEITFHMRECGLSRAELATALDARFDFELSSLKTPDEYTSRGTAEPAPAANHHSFPRAQHQQGATRRH